MTYLEMERRLRNWKPTPSRMDMPREAFEAELDRKLAAGILTREEAEDEWQNYMHRDEGRREW